MLKSDKLITYILLTFIIVGIFLRFYGLSSEYLWSDEKYSMISAIKIHRQDFKSGVLYFQEHPGLGKWLVALPVNFISSNYNPLIALGPNMFAWDFIANEAIIDIYTTIRYMNALIGFFAILFTYLIIKELFNKKAALWSAAIMSVSPDMITYSRHEVLMKIIAITTVLVTLYFYIKYITEKVKEKKWAYLAATIICLTFALGSRNFDPLFIIPTLIISQFFVNRGKENLKENLIVTGLIMASFLFVFFYTYPPEARAFAQEHLQAQSPEQLIGPTFHNMIYLALIRNSYLFAISFILISLSIIMYFNKRKSNDKEKPLTNLYQYLKPNEPKAVLFIFLAVSFLGIGFSRLGSGHMYNIIFYSSIFLLSGIFIVKLTEKYSILNYLFILIMLINIIQILPNFPYSTWDYSNFNLGNGFYENKVDKKIPDAVLNELELNGNPIIDTNMLAIFPFYKGQKLPSVILNEARCSEEYFKSLIKLKPLIVHTEDIKQNQFICKFYKDLPLKEIKNFNNKAFFYEIKT